VTTIRSRPFKSCADGTRPQTRSSLRRAELADHSAAGAIERLLRFGSTGRSRPSAVTRGRPLSGKLKIIAAVLDAPVIERVLTHLGL
jgi:hypothetical protein